MWAWWISLQVGMVSGRRSCCMGPAGFEDLSVSGCFPSAFVQRSVPLHPQTWGRHRRHDWQVIHAHCLWYYQWRHLLLNCESNTAVSERMTVLLPVEIYWVLCAALQVECASQCSGGNGRESSCAVLCSDCPCPPTCLLQHNYAGNIQYADMTVGKI